MNIITIYIFLLIVQVIMCGIFVYPLVLYRKAKNLVPLMEERAHLQEDIVAQQRAISELKEERDDLKNEEAIAKDTIREATKEKKWLEDNQDRVRKLEVDIEHAQNRLADINDNLSKQDEKFREAEQKRKECEIKAEFAEEKLAKDERKYNGLQKEIAELNRAQKCAQEEKAKWERLCEKAKSDCKIKEEERDKLNTEIMELRNSKGKLTSDINTCEETLQTVTQKRDMVISKVDELNDTMGRMSAEKKKKRWMDLERPVCILSQHEKGNKLNESEWLKLFKENLKNCGIVFDERIINAFHTGLKVADASPMVVLAGISGTGKSLLPELYAHAIGMNFLPVAVQPRWDSPQDMFGFFNYMEQRYKATELSRLLWQFDIHNNESAARQFKVGLPMNLVLLDEMNLARVEYYFSDMLSKLEVRRTIDERDKEKRRLAEIELDGGAIGPGEDPKRLFVGPNTLFVGTMNEDETTQALSDKVMDRANVLRFGRPASLKTKPVLEKFRKCYEASQMTLQCWRSKQWHHDITPQHLERLEQIMSNVNEQLAHMGRPFAHRVWQAMAAYVGNYPDASETGFQYAVADQFEMKILPKLNGVEKDDQTVKHVLKEISGILQESVKDERLCNAFEEIRESTDEAFFQWRGITR